MTYEEARKEIRSRFMEPCPMCGGSGEISLKVGETGKGVKHCMECDDGFVLNGMGQALIEFLGDHLTKFADKDHSHFLR